MIKLTKRQEKAFTRHIFLQHFIEEGSGRIVYNFRDHFVLKVAKNKNGYLQNKLEVERYQKYGGERLAKIIAYSKKIIIMEKVITEGFENDKDKSAELTKWLDDICGIASMDHYDSQGMRDNGDIVCYDYGDSKKTYTKRLAEDLTIREWIATKGGEEIHGDRENFPEEDPL